MINNLSIKPFLWLFFQSISLQIFVQENLSVMTCNIQFENPNDGYNQWNNKKNIEDQIQFYAHDIIGIQEVLLHLVESINKNLKYKKYLSVGRDDGN